MPWAAWLPGQKKYRMNDRPQHTTTPLFAHGHKVQELVKSVVPLHVTFLLLDVSFRPPNPFPCTAAARYGADHITSLSQSEFSLVAFFWFPFLFFKGLNLPRYWAILHKGPRVFVCLCLRVFAALWCYRRKRTCEGSLPIHVKRKNAW